MNVQNVTQLLHEAIDSSVERYVEIQDMFGVADGVIIIHPSNGEIEVFYHPEERSWKIYSEDMTKPMCFANSPNGVSQLLRYVIALVKEDMA